MDEQESSPATAAQPDNSPGTATDDVRDPLRALADSWDAEKGKSAGKPADGEGAPPPTAKDKPPKSFNDLAGKLGIKLEDLYKLEVADSKTGKKYTVEDLKGLLAEQDDFTVRSLQSEERLRRKEADFVRAEGELQTLLASLPANAVKPEVLAKVRQSREQKLDVERKRALEAIPEWGDETVRGTELKAIAEHLSDYGLPESFLLANFSAPLLRFVRDSWKRAESIRKALESVTERKSPTPGKSRTQDKAAKPRANGSASTSYDRAVSAFGETINAATGGKRN
ncbi:MAG TPA: hypothetical protein VFJ25_04570 [Casimicrobiaceae bacterium]|nr:hypothetical protein [Casimicrobiaceae bacterium]